MKSRLLIRQNIIFFLYLFPGCLFRGTIAGRNRDTCAQNRRGDNLYTSSMLAIRPIISAIVDGKGNMPAWGDRLNKDQLKIIYDYVTY